MLSRRSFVKACSAAATFPFVMRTPRAAERTYRACVIGHTGRGGYGHGLGQSFQKLSNVTIAAVADPDEKGRAQAARQIGAAKAYANYREMLSQERPNLVAICPYYPDARVEMVRAAAEIGAHVYIEKPLATSLQEADAMVESIEKHRVRSALAHHLRLAPAVVHLKKLVDDGLLGDLLEMRGRGKEDSRAGGEDLMICGWHCHYLMRYFAGEAQWCSARITKRGREVTRADRQEGTIPLGPVAGDSLQASFAFPSGVMGHFASQKEHGARASDFQVVLYGSKGVAQIHVGHEPRIYYLPDPLWSPGRSGVPWQPLPGAPDSSDSSGLTGEGANNKRLVLDLMRAAETGEQSVASIYEARAVLEMVMAVYASHLSGSRAALPLKTRTHPLLQTI